jgi:ZIP family zinc transporter
MMNPDIGFALLLSTLAGLSTTLGSLIGLILRKPGPRFMAYTLGLSGGVMVLVSFVELLPEGIEAVGFAPALIAFFAGFLLMFLVDILIPHQHMGVEPSDAVGASRAKLWKTGVCVALGIAIHNFPEGIATFVGAMEDTSVGIAVAIAVALHNIPEGLAISTPIQAATGQRGRAFLWSFFSGIAEPLGAGLAALALLPFVNGVFLGYTLAVVAGIMVFIAMDELVPVACSFGEEHMPILGAVTGMAIMAFSLWVLQ